MTTKVIKGELIIDLADLVKQDETLLREVAKNAIFDEFVLKAMASLIVSGEIDWGDGESPWWMGSSCYGPNFEKVRAELVKLAPEGARKLVEEIQRQRDILAESERVYQARAWEAERMLQRFSHAIKTSGLDEWDAKILHRITRERTAHAEIDWEKIRAQEQARKNVDMANQS